MGLFFERFPIYNSKAYVDKINSSVREIQVSKDEEGVHTIQFLVYYYLQDTAIDCRSFSMNSTTPFNECPWSTAYKHLKEEMTKNNIHHTDS